MTNLGPQRHAKLEEAHIPQAFVESALAAPHQRAAPHRENSNTTHRAFDALNRLYQHKAPAATGRGFVLLRETTEAGLGLWCNHVRLSPQNLSSNNRKGVHCDEKPRNLLAVLRRAGAAHCPCGPNLRKAP